MDFALSTSEQLLVQALEQAFASVQPDDASACYELLVDTGLNEIDLADWADLSRAITAARTLGRLNGACSIGDVIVAHAIAHTTGDGRLREELDLREPRLGVAHVIRPAEAVGSRLTAATPKIWIVSDPDGRWSVYSDEEATIRQTGAFNPAQPLTLVDIGADPKHVDVETSVPWSLLNLVMHTADLVGAMREMLDRTV